MKDDDGKKELLKNYQLGINQGLLPSQQDAAEPIHENMFFATLDDVAGFGRANLLAIARYWDSEVKYFEDMFEVTNNALKSLRRVPGANSEMLGKLQRDATDYQQHMQHCQECAQFLRDVSVILEGEDVGEGVLLPCLRHEDHFQKGQKVLCFLYPELAKFTIGEVVDCRQPQSGKVVVELKRKVQKGLPYPDYRAVYDLTDPAVLRFEDAIYLHEHQKYFDHWMRPTGSQPEWLRKHLMDPTFKQKLAEADK